MQEALNMPVQRSGGKRVDRGDRGQGARLLDVVAARSLTRQVTTVEGEVEATYQRLLASLAVR